MSKLYDLARMTTATVGTGTITLGSAVPGYLTFVQAGASDGDVVSYGIKDGANSEVGTGTYAAAGTTLTRTVTKSTNSNSAISLSGSAEVYITLRAEDVVTPAASEAQAEAGIDNTVVMTPQAVSQAIATNALTFKNVAGRNGGLEVWQRGASVAVAAATTAYTVDGWYIKTPASASHTISRQSGLTNGSQFSARVQRDSGQIGTGQVYFEFPLDSDELFRLRGNAAILQFTVSTGANWSPASGMLSWNLYCGTGAVAKRGASAFTGETNPITGSVNLAQGASAAQQFSAILGAIGSTITQAALQFTWTPVGTAGASDWFQVDDIDLRAVPAGISAVKPAFERGDFFFDLQRCQRHFWKSFPYGTAPATGAGLAGAVNYIVQISGANYYSVVCSFPVTMRAAPSITFYNPINNNAKWYNNNLGLDSGIAVVAGPSDRAFNAVNNPQVAGDQVPDSIYIHATADAGI